MPVALLGIVPLGLVALVVWEATSQGLFAEDFRKAFWPTGRAVLEGRFAYARSVASPIVWLRYLTLLVVPIALVRPRFSLCGACRL